MNQTQNLYGTENCTPGQLQVKDKSLKQLQKEVAQLKKLANELNPYLPISTRHKKVLEQHHIFSDDPFMITNKLLLLLEESLVELHNRAQ